LGTQRRGKGEQRKAGGVEPRKAVTVEQRKPVNVEPEKKSIPIYPIIAVLSFLGLLDATFLVVEYLVGKTDVCSANGILDCSKVLSSQYSKVGQIPLSELGAVAYFTVFSLAVLGSYGYKTAASYLPILLSGMFLTSLYLFYLQASPSKIGAFCLFCLISAGITTLMTAIIWFAKYRRLV
jgi:uncharacterized membrane protein